jgi:cellulose synthase/poly-beta-1,6-N-acetylglucosamine synthase-like glycosyltransferase
MILSIITAILLLFYGSLMWFFHKAWKTVPLRMVPPDFTPETMVSVVVAARNEERNIARCVESLLAQDYPPELFEIIVVDDQSTDNSSGVLSRYTDPRLLIMTVPAESKGGKKAALALGISAARGTLVLTTDADCVHARRWVSAMVAFYQSAKPVFIAAPVLVKPGSSPVGIFQSLDFMSLQGITAASVHRGFLQMSNGANLGFSAEAFHAVGGYTGIDHLASGDDMLLMQKMADRFPGRTMYCLSRDTIVETRPASTVAEFLRQRIRWASKARSYTDKRMFYVLLLVYLLNLSLLMGGIQAIVRPEWLLPWLGLLIAKTMAETIFLWPVAKFFGSAGLMAWFLPAQPFHILYTVVAGFFGQVRSYTWKGRRWN